MKGTGMWRTWMVLGAGVLGLAFHQAGAQTYPEATVVRTYTTAADFNPSSSDFHPGEPVRNNTIGLHSPGDGALKIRSEAPAVLPFIWVACSKRGTVVRIATEEHYSPIHGRYVNRGDILGEYRAAPAGCAGDGAFPDNDPSRTTVDFDGNVWVGNRGNLEIAGEEVGHIVKIGTGLAHQWIDRNGNGVLDTSTKLGEILDWHNDDAYFSEDDIAYATDEFILLYRPVPARGLRTVAIDRDNNVWLGGRWNRQHGLLDGQTGETLVQSVQLECGGYGGPRRVPPMRVELACPPEN